MSSARTRSPTKISFLHLVRHMYSRSSPRTASSLIPAFAHVLRSGQVLQPARTLTLSSSADLHNPQQQPSRAGREDRPKAKNRGAEAVGLRTELSPTGARAKGAPRPRH